MPSLQEVKDSIDSRLAELSGYIEAKQAECYGAFGIYFQALETHSTPPVDGTVTPADQLDLKPTDQPFGWADVGGFPLTEPVASVRIDTYHGPKGRGFVVVMTFVFDSVTYTKSVNFGPESERSHDWQGAVEEG